MVLNRRQSGTESNFTFKQQTVQTASQWVLEWSWPPMTFAEAETTSGWILSLKGQIGTFRYHPRQRLASALSGKTLAIQGYAYNDTISVGGWSANAGSGLRIGQFFQLGDQLLRIVAAGANADAAGKVTISFEPELRLNYTSGTAVNFANPSGTFRLSTADGLGYTLTPDKMPEFGTIQAREVV
ncbi:hypothetical protein P6144_00295 [Sphingomonas sp. HITSZ_GF]|uniref:hypothetical protein n=1 Tax=Sphingomonas sp. HITSZ_GF TaxID=3037247 RepID=UPI00240D4AD3|nr:hypothetical protein [Sphingomonas sp. HITSZ_GF]MDG2532075.1 hypothetical protein [Sphingomonas sp. HITSZ_GF]